MGRYSRPLAPLLADLAGVGAGQRVLGVGPSGEYVTSLDPPTPTPWRTTPAPSSPHPPSTATPSLGRQGLPSRPASERRTRRHPAGPRSRGPERVDRAAVRDLRADAG